MKYFSSTFKESSRYFMLGKTQVGWINYRCKFNGGIQCIISYYYYNNRRRNEVLIYDPNKIHVVDLELRALFYSL